MKRITSIDVVRGIVMVIMALDHTRDFLLQNALNQNPTDLSNTYPALFFTRWITHLCAPTFVFLSGVSVYISAKNQSNISESRKFLLTRGLWLIFLEFSIISFGIWSDIGFHTLLFQVIAAIGFGFILLSMLIGKSQNCTRNRCFYHAFLWSAGLSSRIWYQKCTESTFCAYGYSTWRTFIDFGLSDTSVVVDYADWLWFG